MGKLTFDSLARLEKAASGDMVFVVTPATKSTAHTSTARTRNVTVELQDSLGNVHTWFTKDIASGVSIADNSTAGTATIPSTTLSFVDGVANVTISLDANTWAAGETDTLTVAAATILGYTVAQKTSVETFS